MQDKKENQSWPGQIPDVEGRVDPSGQSGRGQMGMTGGYIDPEVYLQHPDLTPRASEEDTRAREVADPDEARQGQHREGGGLQGTQAGGTSQMDRMNPGPGGTGTYGHNIPAEERTEDLEEEGENEGEIGHSGMGGSRPDMGLPGEPPQAGPAGNEEGRAYNEGTGTDALEGTDIAGVDQENRPEPLEERNELRDVDEQGKQHRRAEPLIDEDPQAAARELGEHEGYSIQETGDTSISRQDTAQGGNQSWSEDWQSEGITRRMGTGGGREDVSLPREHNAPGPQEVRETEGEP